MKRTENDLISKYLMDYEYEPSLFDNAALRRPKGEVELILGIRPSFGKDTRIIFLRASNKRYIIGQYYSASSFKKIPGYLDLVRNYNSDKEIFTDINHPMYNIEWQFAIDNDTYNSVFDNLANIKIPLKTSKTGMDGISRRIYLNDVRPISVEWWQHYEPFTELTNYVDKVINFSLQQYYNAYPIYM